MSDTKVQPGTTPADDSYYIIVMNRGPFLVYGKPPLKQQFIIPDEDGASWDMADGESYPMDSNPTAICRCGISGKKPYCDGAHIQANWDSELTAPEEPLLNGAKVYGGPTTILTDNQEYCVFARFCDAKGRVWNLVGQSDDETARELTIYESNMCPAGRLSAWDADTKKPHEPVYEPSLVLIEDPAIRSSGGLFVRGGIPIRREDGFTYEIRNRSTLCRCGQSSNKPLCDGTHASFHFDDGLRKLAAEKV